MFFKQFYLGCLAQASYLIGSEGEAAVVDPRRDVDEYLAEAAAQGLRIRYVIETHLHADFVSGHRELAERTGAQVVFGREARAGFPHLAVDDGTELRLGRVRLRFLATPGHTPESVSVLVTDLDASSEPCLALTGDTLFIGDVGRPDLAGGRGFSAQQMAERLYDSLHGKLLALPDHVKVYPAHGAGSLCGRNISKETSSTIGDERRSNYALRPMPREQFVAMMTVDLPEAPGYFALDVSLNREGAPALESRQPPALDPPAVERLLAAGALALDVRSSTVFGAGHLPGAINIALSGQFAAWAGSLLPAQSPLVIVAEDLAGVREAALRLARVGLETVAGHLDGGIAAWEASGRPLAFTPQIAVDELRARLTASSAPQPTPGGLRVLDVRRPGEYAEGHVPGALNQPLDRLQSQATGLDPARPLAVICAGGYRSSAATGLLERLGFRDVVNVVGGTAAWLAAGFEVEKPAAPVAPELHR